jgi:thiamine biosynthesis protein ThiS
MTTSPAIGFRLNGEATEMPAGLTISALLVRLGKNPLAVAIERNGEIVRRARFAEVVVEPGDALEIVQFVQGG